MKTRLKKATRNLFWKALYWLVSKRDAKAPIAKNFPVCSGKNYFYEPLSFKGQEYHVKYFMEKMANPMRTDFGNFKSEILPGQAVGGGETFETQTVAPCVLPVCLADSDFAYGSSANSLSVNYNDEEHNLTKMVKDRYYFLKIDKPGTVKLRSSEDYIVGDPIALQQEKPTRYKLVLCLFVDSLTWEAVKDVGLESMLPNINDYFSKGTIFDNCYTWGNWTLTSAACITSGLGMKKHGMYHPNENYPLGEDYKLMAEYFKDAGYMTFQSCGNWRKTPAYGYVRGYDRSIYKGEMGIEETLYPLLDNLRAYPDRSHFAWVSLNDAHHSMRLTPSPSVQTRLDLADQDYGSSRKKDASLYDRDPPKAARYLEELKNIDFHLGVLFSYINSKYSDDEVLVNLISDHGVRYLTGEGISLARGETHTAMMMRGGGVPTARSHELVQNIDLLPSMLHFSGIPIPDGIDGRRPREFGGDEERETVMSEILYPGVHYQASVKTLDFDLHLESRELIDENGRVDLTTYSVRLFKDGDYTKDVQSEHPGEADRLTNKVLEYRNDGAPHAAPKSC